MICTAHNSESVCEAVMNVCICGVMLAGVRSPCLLAGLFSCLPHETSFNLGHLLPPARFLPLGALFYLCPWPAAAPHMRTHTHNTEKQQMWSHTMRIQGVFIMFKVHHKYLMAELRHAYICIEVKRVDERWVDKIFGRTRLRQSRIWVHLWRTVTEREVRRARTSDDEVERYILAQLRPVGTSVPVLAFYLFICTQVPALKNACLFNMANTRRRALQIKSHS